MSAQLDFGDYWNTTALAGDDLASRRKRAAAQEAAVLDLYRVYKRLGPWQVFDLLGKKWPITSIRRAINTLTGRKALVKLDTYRMGPEGAREHIWGLA